MDTTLQAHSRTALMAAMGRAAHRESPAPHVLDDWLAADLAGPEGRAIADAMRQAGPADRYWTFQAWTAARSRFVEDFVIEAADAGIDQYILLGAGLDSFAYRHPELAGHLTVVEVDHPLSQSWKRARLRELHVAEPRNLVFAPVDFERGSLREALIKAGVAFNRPAVLSWIGVTMYLATRAIEATLDDIACCAPGTRLVLSYDQPPEVLDERGLALLDEVRGAAAELGEPFVTLLRREQMDRLLVRHGFIVVAHFTAPDAQAAYFEGAPMAIPDVQRLATAVVA